MFMQPFPSRAGSKCCHLLEGGGWGEREKMDEGGERKNRKRLSPEKAKRSTSVCYINKY